MIVDRRSAVVSHILWWTCFNTCLVVCRFTTAPFPSTPRFYTRVLGLIGCQFAAAQCLLFTVTAKRFVHTFTPKCPHHIAHAIQYLGTDCWCQHQQPNTNTEQSNEKQEYHKYYTLPNADNQQHKRHEATQHDIAQCAQLPLVHWGGYVVESLGKHCYMYSNDNTARNRHLVPIDKKDSCR